jgi:hypothetical protein
MDPDLLSIVRLHEIENATCPYWEPTIGTVTCDARSRVRTYSLQLGLPSAGLLGGLHLM